MLHAAAKLTNIAKSAAERREDNSNFINHKA